MAVWEDLSSEHRYIFIPLSAFDTSTMLTAEIQEDPSIRAVTGKLKGDERRTNHYMAFPKDEWSFEDADKWITDIKEKFLFQKSHISKNAAIISVDFQTSKFSKSQVEKFMILHGMETSNIVQKGNVWHARVRKDDEFTEIRRGLLMREGIKYNMGLLKIAKSAIEKRVPDQFDLDIEELNELFDMDITEVSLVGSPALGGLGDFQIVKSANENTKDFQFYAPINKVDTKEKKEI